MKKTITYREADGNMITFEYHTSLRSTADVARRYAKEGYPDRYVVFTNKKNKVKTTRKKELELETERGLYMSCILRPPLFPSQAAFLPFISALAMATALPEHTNRSIGIGWISDIYCDGMKIGKASIEGKLDNFTTYEYIIINFECKISKDNFPYKLNDMIQTVFDSANDSVNMHIARNILSKFFKLYANVKSPDKFMSEYTRRFVMRGLRVKYRIGDKWKAHKVLSVDSKSGALIIDAGKNPDIHVTSPALIVNPKKISLKK